MADRQFNLRDFVRKKSGSWWEGRVVGFYSTDQSPDGVAVQLDKPMGPVQIYPASALEIVPAPENHVDLREAAWSLIKDLDRSLVGSRDIAVIHATNTSVKRLRILLEKLDCETPPPQSRARVSSPVENDPVDNGDSEDKP